MGSKAKRKTAGRVTAPAVARAARAQGAPVFAGGPHVVYWRSGAKSFHDGVAIAARWAWYRQHAARILDAEGAEIFSAAA